jgi:hypothetical protein
MRMVTGTLRNDRRNREGVGLVRSQTYEITFAGRAGAVMCSLFDDCEINIGPHSTTLRAELPDQEALCGLIQRVVDFRLQVTGVRLVPSG